MKTRAGLFLLSLLFAAGAADAATTFKIATLAPEGTAWIREMRAAGAAVAQRTEGRVEFKYYPGGVMGNDVTVLRKMRVGQLQGGGFTGSELSPLYPDAMIYGLPFLLRDQAEADAVRGQMDPRIKEGLAEKGLVAASIVGSGFAYLLSTQPIQGREDLIKSKAWVPQGDLVSEVTYEVAGVNPVPLSIADVYTGLQTGLVDTVANTPSGTLAFQWHTRIRHLVDMPIAYIIGILALDKRTFDRLDAGDQAIVLEEFASAGKRLEAQTIADNQAASEALRKEGIEFFEPNAEERAYWQSVGEQAAAELMRRGTFSQSNYDALLAALRAARGG
jgi:TRAP-type C4-dicarboxylate transport system substrate-binding protein